MPSYVRREVLDDRTFLLRELSSVGACSGGRSHPLIDKLRAIVPFDEISVTGIDREGCGLGQGIYLAADLCPNWRRTYTERRLVTIDPLVKRLSPADPVASWEDLGRDDIADDGPRQFVEALERADIAPRTGVSLWNGDRLYGAVLVTRRKSFTPDERETLRLFAEPLHSELARPVLKLLNRRLGLGQGEVRCLAAAAAGLTTEEIAILTRYTVDTVGTYLKSAMKKLGAANRTQAVARAIRWGIID